MYNDYFRFMNIVIHLQQLILDLGIRSSSTLHQNSTLRRMSFYVEEIVVNVQCPT